VTTRPNGERVVKILDFGIAKAKMQTAFDSFGTGLTHSGALLGTPHFMSPEQAQGLKTIDERTDLWSLGVVLYVLLGGRAPTQHLEGLGQIVLALCSNPPAPIESVAPWIPDEVKAVVTRSMRIDPAERFQTAAEMFGALFALLPEPRTIAIEEATIRALREEERCPARSRPDEVGPRFGRARPWRGILLLGLALGATLGGLVAFVPGIVTSRSTEPPPLRVEATDPVAPPEESATVDIEGARQSAPGSEASDPLAPAEAPTSSQTVRRHSPPSAASSRPSLWRFPAPKSESKTKTNPPARL
jgi:serine/threonine protein kinase